MEFQIKQTRAADAAFLPTVERSAGEVFRTIPSLSWIADDDDRSVNAHLAHIESGTSWVATNAADSPVGFLIADVVDGELHIEELAVRHDWQGRGCGRALVIAAITAARAQGLRGVTLTTFRDVPWNAPFYGRMGFRLLAGHEVGRRLEEVLREDVERGLSHEQRCAMRLDLSPAVEE